MQKTNQIILSHSKFHSYKGFRCGKVGVTEVQNMTANISVLMKPMNFMCTSAEVIILHK